MRMKEFLRKLYKFLWDDPAQPVFVSDLWRNDAVKKCMEAFVLSELKDTNGVIIIWTKLNDDSMYTDYSGLDQARALGLLQLAGEDIKQQKVRRLD